MSKFCTGCSTEKPVDAFQKITRSDGRSYLYSLCNPCKMDRQKAFRAGKRRRGRAPLDTSVLDQDIELVRSEVLSSLRAQAKVVDEVMIEAERMLDTLVIQQPADWWRRRVERWSVSKWIELLVPEYLRHAGLGRV